MSTYEASIELTVLDWREKKGTLQRMPNSLHRTPLWSLASPWLVEFKRVLTHVQKSGHRNKIENTIWSQLGTIMLNHTQ